MRSVKPVLFATLLLLSVPASPQETDGCSVREALLPQIDGWAQVVMEGLPPGREGCLMMRFADEETVAGLIAVRATPYDSPGIGDEPQPQLMAELIGYLKQMNITVGEPRWRRTDTPAASMEGFGNFAMFGFDGEVIGGDGRSDVIMLFFDGPLSHFDAMLLTEPESVSSVDYRTNLRAYRELLSRLNAPDEPGEPGD